jgi:hypothetical protein
MPVLQLPRLHVNQCWPNVHRGAMPAGRTLPACRRCTPASNLAMQHTVRLRGSDILGRFGVPGNSESALAPVANSPAVVIQRARPDAERLVMQIGANGVVQLAFYPVLDSYQKFFTEFYGFSRRRKRTQSVQQL